MNTNTFYVLLAIIAIGGIGYWYIFGSTGNDSPLSVTPIASGAELKFQKLSSQLPPSLDVSVLSDARFTSLVDITQPIQQETIGKSDPFGPLPGLPSKAGASGQK